MTQWQMRMFKSWWFGEESPSPWEHKVVTDEWAETLVEEIVKAHQDIGRQLGKAQVSMDKRLGCDSKPVTWGVHQPVMCRKFPVNKHLLTHR